MSIHRWDKNITNSIPVYQTEDRPKSSVWCLKLATVGDKITLSGREFHTLTTRLEKIKMTLMEWTWKLILTSAMHVDKSDQWVSKRRSLEEDQWRVKSVSRNFRQARWRSCGSTAWRPANTASTNNALSALWSHWQTPREYQFDKSIIWLRRAILSV